MEITECSPGEMKLTPERDAVQRRRRGMKNRSDFEENLGGERGSSDHCFIDQTKDVSQDDQTRRFEIDLEESHDLF